MNGILVDASFFIIPPAWRMLEEYYNEYITRFFKTPSCFMTATTSFKHKVLIAIHNACKHIKLPVIVYDWHWVNVWTYLLYINRIWTVDRNTLLYTYTLPPVNIRAYVHVQILKLIVHNLYPYMRVCTLCIHNTPDADFLFISSNSR